MFFLFSRLALGNNSGKDDIYSGVLHCRIKSKYIAHIIKPWLSTCVRSLALNHVPTPAPASALAFAWAGFPSVLSMSVVGW